MFSASAALTAAACASEQGTNGLDSAAYRFSANLSCEVASAYISTSGGLYDTCPVSTQMLNWRQRLGDLGGLDGYFWMISALHDKQHERHRALFYNSEGAIRYGYDVKFADGIELLTKGGTYFGLPFGYRDAHMKCWGPTAMQSLENPYLVPYWRGLWLLEPHQRGRIAAGLRKNFRPLDDVTLSFFAEGIWMDHRRFDARYGGEPEKKTLLGGAVAFIVFGVKCDWNVSKDVKLYASASQYDVINPQARDSIRRGSHYYDKCDWPIFKIGIMYSF